MGVRSDVALAVKRKAWDSLTVEQRGNIAEVLEWADQTLENSKGYLFSWSSIKWYHDSYKEIMALYEVLDKLERRDFMLVCATPEYADDCEADRGGWFTNPWELNKIIDVRLEFYENGDVSSTSDEDEENAEDA